MNSKQELTMEQELAEIVAKGPTAKSEPLPESSIVLDIINSQPTYARLATIAKTICGLGTNFSSSVYDDIVLRFIARGPWEDSKGVRRQIRHSKIPLEGGAMIANGVLVIPEEAWNRLPEYRDLIVDSLGRYLTDVNIAAPLTDSQKATMQERTRNEMTAFSDFLNDEFSSMTEGQLNEMAFIIRDSVFGRINFITKNMFTRPEHIDGSFDYIRAAIDPANNHLSATPFIAACNRAIWNGLFLDTIAFHIYQQSVGLAAAINMGKMSPDDYISEVIIQVLNAHENGLF